jgi:hypothetical protein
LMASMSNTLARPVNSICATLQAMNSPVLHANEPKN